MSSKEKSNHSDLLTIWSERIQLTSHKVLGLWEDPRTGTGTTYTLHAEGSDLFTF